MKYNIYILPVLLLAFLGISLQTIWNQSEKIHELNSHNTFLEAESKNIAEEAAGIRVHNVELAKDANSCHLFIAQKGLSFIYRSDQQEWDEGGS